MMDYSYLHGLPTSVSPCPMKCSCNDDVVCDPVLGPIYRRKWKEQFMGGCADMGTLLRSPQSECASCSAERTRRHRVLSSAESLKPELQTHPFSGAPALYTFNVPMYFATNLRARQFAKQKKCSTLVA